MRTKTRRAKNRNKRLHEHRGMIRHSVYILNLLFGIATHGCELASFGSYWLAPDNLTAPIVKIEREFDNVLPADISRSLECQVPSYPWFELARLFVPDCSLRLPTQNGRPESSAYRLTIGTRRKRTTRWVRVSRRPTKST